MQPHERNSVESRMVRYRFGPWDHRYRTLLNLLVAQGLAVVAVEGRTISIGITTAGAEKAAAVAESGAFSDLARRAKIIHAHFDLTATNLMRFIYNTFPELLTLRANEAIGL